MYIDDVYGCYTHVYRWCIFMLYTCMLIMDMGAIFMYIDGVY